MFFVSIIVGRTAGKRVFFCSVATSKEPDPLLPNRTRICSSTTHEVNWTPTTVRQTCLHCVTCWFSNKLQFDRDIGLISASKNQPGFNFIHETIVFVFFLTKGLQRPLIFPHQPSVNDLQMNHTQKVIFRLTVGMEWVINDDYGLKSPINDQFGTDVLWPAPSDQLTTSISYKYHLTVATERG